MAGVGTGCPVTGLVTWAGNKMSLSRTGSLQCGCLSYFSNDRVIIDIILGFLRQQKRNGHSE